MLNKILSFAKIQPIPDIYHKYVWIGLGLITLVAAKLYFRGTQCKVKRDLSGKVAIVTGGNTGIGKETVVGLIKENCLVIIGARDEAKTNATITEIKKQYPNSKLYGYRLDLGDRESIREFSSKVFDKVQCIDLLINNAGVMAIPKQTLTTNGFEMQMGVNHFGHFHLTFLLWRLLCKSEEPRIICVSSRAHKRKGIMLGNVPIDFADINYRENYNPFTAYSRSKAANILFAKQLQRRMDASQIPGLAMSLHPGVVRTELIREMSLGIRIVNALLWPLRMIIMKSAKEGAQTTLYLAMERSDKLVKGGYYSDCALAHSSDFTNSAENARILWQKSEQQLSIRFQV